MTNSTRPLLLGLLAILFALACASPDPPERGRLSNHTERATVVRTAKAQVGAPYRYGGSSPKGFDCSGLVVYSYRKTGLTNLPHSAAALDALSREVSLQKIEPGDLLFFRLGRRKSNHVGIYVGDREFVHAPSSGKRVEKVSFDHVYWGGKIRRAGRLLP